MTDTQRINFLAGVVRQHWPAFGTTDRDFRAVVDSWVEVEREHLKRSRRTARRPATRKKER